MYWKTTIFINYNKSNLKEISVAVCNRKSCSAQVLNRTIAMMASPARLKLCLRLAGAYSDFRKSSCRRSESEEERAS